jgi:hypothetical protein
MNCSLPGETASRPADQAPATSDYNCRMVAGPVPAKWLFAYAR